MRVILGEKFKIHFKNFPKNDRQVIFDFIAYVEENGFDGLQGRNKSSDDVPTNNPNWLADVKHAQKYKLWHYLRTEIAKHCFARSQDKGYARSGRDSALCAVS